MFFTPDVPTELYGILLLLLPKNFYQHYPDKQTRTVREAQHFRRHDLPLPRIRLILVLRVYSHRSALKCAKTEHIHKFYLLTVTAITGSPL